MSAVVIVVLTAVFYTVDPVHRGFFCNDDSIGLPYRADTVTPAMVMGGTFGGSLCLMLLVELPRLVRALKGDKRDQDERGPEDRWSVGRLVATYGAYVYGYLLVTLLSQLLKLCVGQLRPNFLAVCQPNVNLDNCTGFIESFECTNKNATRRELMNARESFPSGHASLAFYFATFLVLFVEARMHVRHARLPKLTLQAALVMTSLYVCATRVTDFKHRPADVIVGGLLGILVALVMYYQVAQHWLRSPRGRVEEQNYNSNNSNTDTVFAEAGEPSTPTPLLSKYVSRVDSGAHLGPLRLHIP